MIAGGVVGWVVTSSGEVSTAPPPRSEGFSSHQRFPGVNFLREADTG